MTRPVRTSELTAVKLVLLPPFAGALVARARPCRLSVELGHLWSIRQRLEAELDQAAFLKGLGAVELQKLVQIVGALA